MLPKIILIPNLQVNGDRLFFMYFKNAVGVMDMLRFPKFTIGWAWCAEYGNPEENEAEFKALYAYFSLHNLKSGTKYPATLITTADPETLNPVTKLYISAYNTPLLPIFTNCSSYV